ncbi:hypothetical protein C8R31_101119 [Nitrosospira sp. Nsp2]|uniref:hypothetical protein n=1 Tax=Nitrosospira sp. Nsp2 TaxID=136548 RepID=UPI000D2FF545|nr:hypothetical protein [Nitrosospira sp. Nsp2]PTR16966.1 hypothetical protein C8R31_101119 [Nitrosospira sp. Nsp2]
MSLVSYLENTLPPSPQREEALSLIRLGLSFQKHHRVGKRPGPLKAYLLEVTARIETPLTFDRLLDELELEAARRNIYGTEASPIEKVDRVWEVIVFHHPRAGRQSLTFKTIRNKLTWCKLNLNP